MFVLNNLATLIREEKMLLRSLSPYLLDDGGGVVSGPAGPRHRGTPSGIHLNRWANQGENPFNF
jgi:hypothetical protein